MLLELCSLVIGDVYFNSANTLRLSFRLVSNPEKRIQFNLSPLLSTTF